MINNNNFSETKPPAFRSAIQGNTWPAISSPPNATMLALHFQLERSQWLAEEELRAKQLSQLRVLLCHAIQTVPYYREQHPNISAAMADELSYEQFLQLPILKRTDLQKAGTLLHSRNMPKAHGKVAEVSSSGSTGRPVKGLSTDLTRLIWQTITMRDDLWHQRDFNGKLAVIRPEGDIKQGQTIRTRGWGKSAGCVHNPGELVGISVTNDIAFQAKWLLNQDPQYLLTLPSNLIALAKHFRENSLSLPGLKEISTYGEVSDEKADAACLETWPGVRRSDAYSATEVGYLALQCPEERTYHIQSESVFLEVLDQDGRPCQPGEIGEVVVTALHNFAMPLIRYALGDFAELGKPCACGRGLPTLKRILGRQRNMLVLPDGRTLWPSFPASLWQDIGGIQQIQLVQTSHAEIQVNYVAMRNLNEQDMAAFSEKVGARLGHPFNFTFKQFAEIPRSKTGKYEDFVSQV